MSGKPPAQKAWTTGTNPITQKQGGTSMANGLANGHSQTAQEQGKTEGRGGQAVDKQAHDRLLFLLANFVGLDATLSLKNGEQFKGVFSGASSQNGPPRYHMAMVRKSNITATNGAALDASDTFLGDGEEYRMAFDVSETSDLSVNGVTFGALQSRIPNGSAFRTDTEISGNLNAKERTLQRWQPGPDDRTDLSLGSEASHGNGQWDQFAANEALYNVRSDYDEDLYTTSIDRTNPRFKQIEARAEKLAREIEGNPKRNDAAVDSGLDEEDKYSGVRRDTSTLNKSGPNAYVPPSKRPITTNKTVSGAPFDPAIISSQLARPDTSAAPPQPATKTESVDKGKQVAADTTETATKPSAPGAVNGTSGTKPVIAALPSGKTAVEHGTDIMRNVSDAFKIFSQGERLKVQSEKFKIAQNQQQRTAHARQEKSVKINDLKKFSQNFKLNSLVPDDLVPILAKSKEKQEEIIQKAEQQVREREELKAHSSVAESTSTAASRESRQTSQPPTQTTDRSTGAKMPADPQNQSQQVGRASAAPAAAMSPRPPANQNQSQNQRAQATFRSTAAGAGINPSLVPAPSQTAAGGQAEPSRVLSPTSASAAARSFNAKALEFKPNPTASAFAPTGAGTDTAGSKRPSIASPTPASVAEAPQIPFFSSSNKKSKFAGGDWASTTANVFNVPARLLKETQSDETKKSQFANNGGIPQGYRTAPVWSVPEANAEKSYVDFFPKTAHPASSPMHVGQNSLMPHQHQLPLHLQNGTPHAQQQPQFYRAQHHPMSAQHSEDQRMHYSSSTSSVQPSPRMAQQAVAFNGQNPIQMTGFPYAMTPAGMSPGMGMRPVPGAGQYMTPQGAPIGGHMMVQQPSNGPYGHAGQQQMQMYPSPVPNHVQPQFGGHPGQPGMPGGFAGSPRAHPMSHTGSQQGHAPQQMFMMPNQMMMMMPQHNGPPPMRGYQGQYQNQHPQTAYAMQHRTMSSSGYGQNMTPRQQHAMPHQGSMGTPMHPSASTNGEDGR